MKHLKGKDLKEYRTINTPKVCPIFKCEPIPVVDHDHKEGWIRGVIDRDANQFEGKITGAFRRYGTRAEVNLPTALRNMADYIERKHTGIMHPKGIVTLVKRFKNKPAHEQKHILHGCGFTEEHILECKNKAERGKLFRKYLCS